MKFLNANKVKILPLGFNLRKKKCLDLKNNIQGLLSKLNESIIPLLFL